MRFEYEKAVSKPLKLVSFFLLEDRRNILRMFLCVCVYVCRVCRAWFVLALLCY